jgi:hypothetical protein
MIERAGMSTSSRMRMDALLAERGTETENGRTGGSPYDLANADVLLGYSHAATGAYEAPGKSKRRAVTRGHGENDDTPATGWPQVGDEPVGGVAGLECQGRLRP